MEKPKPKELWKALKSLGLPSKITPVSQVSLKDGETISFDEKTNNNSFKNFYANLALNLVNKLPHAPNKFDLDSVLAYYKRFLNTENQKFTFSPTSEDEILKLLTDTNPEKAAGIDNLSGRFLKDGAVVLALPISKLCNLSKKHSKFPLDCKISKLKPLYKKGSKTDPRNYRPVSLLPLVSKVIEIFLNKNKILYKYQSGFRKSFSTNSCLTLFTDKINKGFESGKYVGLILIDLQKAFDTTDHEILLKKMGCIGFSQKVILWFESYLSGRTFKANIDRKFSDPGNLTCGVLQGSILGPILFLLYVNDMHQAAKCDLFLYADDTCLTFEHENVKKIEDQLNLNFSSLFDWFIDNKLSIHLGQDKTKSILFGNKLNIN